MNEKSKEIKLRGGEILAHALKEKGAEHVFTLAGGFCNPALEGFMKCQMPVINCPHEQVAGHLADGNYSPAVAQGEFHDGVVPNLGAAGYFDDIGGAGQKCDRDECSTGPGGDAGY